MTEHHHPAIAEQIAKYEEKIADCTASLAHYEREQERVIAELHSHQSVLAAYIDAEQRLTDAFSPIFAERELPRTIDADIARVVAPIAPQPEMPSKRIKRDVRGLVMACFAAEGNHLLSENYIVERTGLPAASIHAYLPRAVKSGELVREGALYGSMQPTAITLDQLAGKAPFVMPREDAPSPEKILDTIRRAGDMGMSAAQLEIIGATDDQLDELLSAGRVDYQDDDRRYRIAEDATVRGGD